MAVTADTWLAYDGQTVNGEDLRRAISDLTGTRPGIFHPDDFEVTEAAAPAMKVDVAAGAAILPGTSISGNTYTAWDADTEVTITASDPTNARIDIIAIKTFTTGTDNPTLVAITGIASGSPAIPTMPADHYELAQVAVGNGVSSILNANITDTRRTTSSQSLAINQGQLATAHGGVIVCTSTTRPTANLYAGIQIYQTNDDRYYRYNGTSWVPNTAFVEVQLDSAVSINNDTETDVIWESAPFESPGDDMWAVGSPTQVTLIYPGIWLIHVETQWTTDSDGYRRTTIEIDSTVEGRSTAAAAPGVRSTGQVVAQHLSDGTDVVVVTVQHTAGAAINLESAAGQRTYLRAVYLGNV